MKLDERRIPLAARTMYSEILERISSSPVALAGLLGAGGSFVSKTVRGRTYRYYQWREGGRTRQAYLGPATSDSGEAIGELQRDRRNLQALVRMVLSGGGVGLDAEAFRYLREMASAGIFARGAVLVGTYAFVTYQNLMKTS